MKYCHQNPVLRVNEIRVNQTTPNLPDFRWNKTQNTQASPTIELNFVDNP